MIRLALPTGDLRQPTGELLARAGLEVDDYLQGSRSYLFRVPNADGVQLRVFREKDIPIQIALGNYDLGVCGLDWVEDFRQRFPTDAVVPLRDLGIGRRLLYAAASDGGEDLMRRPGLRIVSEYANLAEAFAMGMRLASYRVFPVWGSAEAYPPEDADLALIAVGSEDDVRRRGLSPIFSILEGSAWLIANRESMASKDLSAVLNSLLGQGVGGNGLPKLSLPLAAVSSQARLARQPSSERGDAVRLAIPDGHQQKHAVAALEAAGLRVSGYDANRCETRPQAEMAGLELKVIRPQDMPQQVALGRFDLAITGRDWLLDHLYCFPASPVEEAVDLDLGRYSVAAVVSEDVPADRLEDALAFWRQDGRQAIRLASEYANIADHCARTKHFGRYQVIPIGGASEGFVPEDAEVLIEGTETGATLKANRLKPIDVLMQSTTCLIRHAGRLPEGRRRAVERLVEMFEGTRERRE